MRTTLGIISQVRNIANAIKNTDKKRKEASSANKALINKLLEMEKAYNEKTAKPTPNYDKQVPQSLSSTPTLKDDKQLQQEATDYVSQMVEQHRQQTEAKAKEKITKLEDKRLQGYKKYTDSQEKTTDKFGATEEKITGKTIRQGITHSSIKEDWHRENMENYLHTMEIIRQDYDEYMAQIDAQISLINQAKQQSLAEYDITLAALYEKKLQELRKEQIASMEEQEKYEKHYKEQADKLYQQQLEKELLEGYSGEKAVEMEERYGKALEFYKSLDKSKALKYIADNKSQLKQTLGWYYWELVEEIKKQR